MNNATTNMTAAAIDAFIQESYETYVFDLSIWSSSMLLLYVTLLNLGQEVAFIWSRSFSWPSLLYIFARYGALFSIGFRLGFYYTTSLGRICTLFKTAEGVFAIFGFTGIQGLLVVRACSFIEPRGKGILSKVFALLLLSGTILQLTENIIFDKCSAGFDGTYSLILLLININIILTDLLVFSVCMWKVWGTWNLGGCHAGVIRSSNSISSLLIKQGILRCCFVTIVTVVLAIMSYRFSTNFISDILSFYQNALSSIMMANFTLELRHQHTASIEASNVSLSSIMFSNVENVQQSIEMTTLNQVEGQNVGDVVDGNQNNISTIIDIRSA